jgi:hypothetical protein
LPIHRETHTRDLRTFFPRDKTPSPLLEQHSHNTSNDNRTSSGNEDVGTTASSHGRSSGSSEVSAAVGNVAAADAGSVGVGGVVLGGRKDRGGGFYVTLAEGQGGKGCS